MVALVCLVFLWHVRSALVAIITLPIAILLSFVPMSWMHLTSNIMSLGGIAIAIGAMVDAAIIMVENAHKGLEHFREEHGREPDSRERFDVIIAAAKTVGRPLFFSLLVITVSFIPVFSLDGQEGRLFQPLAFTKTFSMFFAALLGVTLVPVLMTLLIRGKITPESRNPVNRFLICGLQPGRELGAAPSLVDAGVRGAAAGGDGLSRTADWARNSCRRSTKGRSSTCRPPCRACRSRRRRGSCRSRIAELMRIPEVARVFGKAGQAETSTDPAPLSMFETVVSLKPPDQWRARHDMGQTDRGDECEGAHAGHGEYLLDADPDAHGDADDGLPQRARA